MRETERGEFIELCKNALDDLESEANEVWNVGNTFFTYSLPIHICRMAGCFSVIADWMDEIELQPHYANKLISEITNCNNLVNNGLSDRYCEQVNRLNSENPLVYNIRSKQFSPIINICRLYLLQYFYPIKQKIGLTTIFNDRIFPTNVNYLLNINFVHY